MKKKMALEGKKKKKHQLFIRYMHKDSKWKIIEVILWDLTGASNVLGYNQHGPCLSWAPGTSYTVFVQVSLSNLLSEQDSDICTSLKLSWRYAVEVAEHHVPYSLLTAAAVHRNWSLSATQQHVKSVLLRTRHFLCQEVLFSPPSMTARQGGIWDEMGVWASLSGLKELHQTLIVRTEVTEGGQLSCLCGHCVPTELINKDCSWRVLNWTRLLLFYRASGTHSFVFLSQVIPAEAENLTELLLPSWKVSRIKVLMEKIMVTEALELCM